MIFWKKMRTTLFGILFSVSSMTTWAETYQYRADVEGMVCAFCVYSVSKNIRKLDGVDPDSVNVSLKNKSAEFSANKKISKQALTSLFSQSAFSLSNLTVEITANKIPAKSKVARLDLKVDVFDTDQFTWVLQAIGDIAVKTPSRFVVEAPAEQEETILKALLMGRKQVVQVHFIENDQVDNIHIQLFPLLN